MESIISRDYIIEQVAQDPCVTEEYVVTSFKEMEDLAEKGAYFHVRSTEEGYESYGFAFKLGTLADFGAIEEILGDIFPSCKVAFGTLLGEYEEPDLPMVVLVEEDKVIFIEEIKYFDGLIVGYLIAQEYSNRV